MAGIERIFRCFSGYFLTGSAPGRVVKGCVDAPVGPPGVPSRDNVDMARTPEKLFGEPIRGRNLVSGAPLSGQFLRAHFRVNRGSRSANNQKEKIFEEI